MSGPVAKIVVLGALHLDIMVTAPGRPKLGETLPGQTWAMKPGGKGGNQAVAAAAHGAPPGGVTVAMLGAVGGDGFGVRLLDHLHDSGVDIAGVMEREDAVSGMSVAIIEPSGDYGAVIVSGVNLTIDAATASEAVIAGAAWVVLQNEVPEAANLAAATLARRHGAKVMLNAAPFRRMPPALLALVDVLVVNAVEAEAQCGIAVDSLAEAARAAMALTGQVACAIVTAGASGLAVAARDGTALTLPAHRVRVVSTHGAGDCFVGALAARLAGGSDLPKALRYANAAAALLVATPDAARADLRPAMVEDLLLHV